LAKFHGLKALYDKFPWLVLGGAIGVSGALAMIGEVLQFSVTPFPDRPWWHQGLIYLGDLATVVLTGGIVAAITRVFALSGYFREALAEVVDARLRSKRDAIEASIRTIVEETMLDDRAIDRRNDVEELWRKVTRKVLLPGFVQKDAMDAEFLRSFNASLRAVIDQRVNYYVDKMDRTYNIKLAEDGVTALIEERSLFEVVPFDPAEEVVYKMRFLPTAGNELTAYGIEDRMFKVEGKDEIPKIASMVTATETERTVPVTLRGRSRYRVERITCYRQPIDKDPLFICAPDHVSTGAKVKIRCLDPALSAVFGEYGFAEAFEPQFEHDGSDRSEQDFVCTRTMLPEQGFMIILARIAPSVSH